MKNIYNSISFKIAILFTSAMFLSFIPEHFHSFFGDDYCIGNIHNNECINGWIHSHSNSWHWGYRHWLWCIMGIVLFIINIIKIVENEK